MKKITLIAIITMLLKAQLGISVMPPKDSIKEPEIISGETVVYKYDFGEDIRHYKAF